MSILRKSELKALRKSRGIVPDREDDVCHHYRRREVVSTGSNPTVNDEGVSVLSSSDEDEPTGYELLGTHFCRVEAASKGREADFGGSNAEVAPWDLVMTAIYPNGDEIVVSKGDLFLVDQPDSAQKQYQAVSADDGETYGVLLTVNCQYIET